jgi:hypothetical protein
MDQPLQLRWETAYSSWCSVPMAKVLGFGGPSETLASVAQTGGIFMRMPFLACLLLLVC